MKQFIAAAVCTVFMLSLAIPILIELTRSIEDLQDPPIQEVAQELDPAITAEEIDLLDHYFTYMKGAINE